MDSKYLIKIAFIIFLAILFIYFKKEQNKNDKKSKIIIDKYKIRKSKTEIHRPSVEEKQKQSAHLKQLINFLINPENSKKIIKVIETRNNKINNTNYWNISNELVCQEVIDYQYKNNIFLYGFFDWKSEPIELEEFLKKAVKSNFDIDISFEKKIDLSQYKFIHEVFPEYKDVLAQFGIELRNIDINSDSYQIILIESEKYLKVKTLIDLMNLKLQILSS